MRANKKLHYAWVVAAITFVILLVGAGVRATPSILIVPLQKEFGWSTATISGAIAVNIFLYGMLGPFAVALMERFGLRRTVCTALVVVAGGVALTALMREPWQMMLLWGVLVGAGTGMTAMGLGAAIAGRWFVRHRGLVVGALSASSATGQLVFLPLLASLAIEFGWRMVSLTVGIVVATLVPLVALLLRDRPSDLGLPRYGETELHPIEHSGQNPFVRAFSALGRGLRSREFWLLSGTFFICGASTNGLIGTHLISACIDHGIPEVAAAGLLALMGIFDLVGTTASGWLTDRYDSRKLLAWYYGLRGLSLMYLPYSFDLSFYGLSLFAVFYGLDWIATIPPTVKLAGQAFGEQNAALMFAWIACAHQIGAAFAAWLAGYLRTETGDYFSAFFSAGALCLLAVVLIAFVHTGPGRQRPPAAAAAVAA